MGQVIVKSAAAVDIVRHAQLTVARASSRGELKHQAALRFLEGVLAKAADLARRLAEVNASLDELGGKQLALDDSANDLISKVKDEYFNLIGRTAGDPVFQQIFPNGAATFKEVPPAEKPVALTLAAESLDTVRHPEVPAEQVDAFVAALRDAGAELEAVNHALLPIRASRKVLGKMYAINARHTQTQLARLKRYWKSEGMSEPDIHAMIPDAGAGVAAPSVPEVQVAPSEEPVTLAEVPAPEEEAA